MYFNKLIKLIQYFHVEERLRRNKDHEAPTFSEMSILIEDINSNWQLVSSYFNLFHDNFKDLPELKFINLDGREYVYTADETTGVYIFCTDPNIKGSYNYFPPMCDKKKNIIIKFLILSKQYIGHFCFDICPYLLFKF